MLFDSNAAFIVIGTIVSMRVIFVPLRNAALHGPLVLCGVWFPLRRRSGQMRWRKYFGAARFKFNKLSIIFSSPQRRVTWPTHALRRMFASPSLGTTGKMDASRPALVPLINFEFWNCTWSDLRYSQTSALPMSSSG